MTCLKASANQAKRDRKAALKPTFAQHFKDVTGKELNV